ncbi:MAG: hypothetical protein C4341_04515 [Armatimonadota bacterium]
MSSSRKRWVLWGAGLLVAASLLAYYFIFRVPSPEEVAKDAIAAIEAGDGRRLLRLISEEEVAGLGLTEESLSCLLRTLFSQYARAELRDGEVALEPKPDMGVVFVRQPYRLPDGREWSIEADVTTGSGRPKIENALRVLIYGRIWLEFDRLREEERADKRQALARLFEELAPELQKCGLMGMPTLDELRFVYSVEPWEQYISRLRGNGR